MFFIMENNLFLGLQSYQTSEAEYLPQRGSELRMLRYMLREHGTTILTSDDKMGKTSLINAALAPAELSDSHATAIRFDIPPFRFGDLVLEKKLTKAIQDLCDKPTYLDLCLDDDQSLWYAAKRLQAIHKDTRHFYLILDSFENIFTYGSAARNEFATAIATLLQGETPPKYQETIQKIIMGEGGATLPPDAMPLLLDNPSFHALFAVSKAQYSYMAQFCGTIRGLLQHTLEINPFDVETAKAAAAEIAAQPIDGIPTAEIEPTAIDSIISRYARNGGVIVPGILRNAILYLRTQAHDGKVSADDLKASGLLGISSTQEALGLIDQEQRNGISEFIANEMLMENETQPLPAYRGIAMKRYSLSEDTLNTMESHYILRKTIGQDSRIYYLPYSGEVFRELTADIAVRPGKKTPDAPKPAPLMAMPAKTKPMSRTAIFLITVLCLICLASVFVAFKKESDALRMADRVKSTTLASWAVYNQANDPTLGLRLSQMAIQLDKSNINAYRSLLTSFYNTGIFYNITGKITNDCNEIITKVEICHDDSIYVAALIRNDSSETYSVRIMAPNGDIRQEIPHKSEVTSVCIRGRQILTTSYDSTARLFGMDGGLIMEIKGHEAILWTGDISPDGRHLLTAGGDCNIMVWDMEGKKTACLRGHDFDVYSARFSASGDRILSSSGDNTARIWTADGKSCKILETKGEASLISKAIFSPCGKYVLLASNDRTNRNHRVRLFDIDGNERINYEGHMDFVNSVNFSHDGKHVITASRDKIVRVFSIDGQPERELKGHEANVWSADFYGNDNTIISCGDDHTIRTWNIVNRFEEFDNTDNINYAVFSPNSNMIMVVKDSTAEIWKQTGEVASILKGHKGSINKARFSHDSQMAITTYDDGTAIIWNSKGEMIKSLHHDGASVNDGAFSNDGKYVVTVCDDSKIMIHNLETGEEKTAIAHYGGISCVCFTPNGKAFATGGDDGNVIIHDMDGKGVKTFHAHDGRITSIDYSNDGNYIVTSSTDNTAALWNSLGMREQTMQIYGYCMNSAQFSPDSKYIATTCDDGTARIWNTSGNEIMNFGHEGKVSNAVFSPDGEYLMSVYRTEKGLKTIKMRLLSPDGIIRHIDELSLYGKVWQLDSITLKKYGIE